MSGRGKISDGLGSRSSFLSVEEERLTEFRSENQAGQLHFAVDCRLLLELGEKLVARKSVALAELVKNAYDADATRVVVRLSNVTGTGGGIDIEDNGLGMTLERIAQAWMRIATDDKEQNPTSKLYARPRTGAKGIGRFASRRLARHLVMKSTAKRTDGRFEQTTVTFDWTEFRPGRSLEEIPNDYESQLSGERQPTGVTLSLTGLREAWNEDEVAELQKDLFGLISPFPVPKGVVGQSAGRRDPGFSFDLDAPEFPSYTGPLGNKFLSASWGRLTGRIKGDGKARYHLRTRTGGVSSFLPERVFQKLGPTQFRLHFFVYRSEFFKGGAAGVGDARRLATEHSGVRIYLDAFRVFPYGDERDDWLGLDKDRAQRVTAVDAELTSAAKEVERPMLLIPGNNQLFGVVFISRLANPGIELTASRERLLENEAFDELRSFVRLGIDWLTVEYARYVQDRKEKERPEENAPLHQLMLARERIEKAPELSRETKTEVLQALTLATRGIEAKEQEQISELSMIRVLASVGTMVVIFDHELRATIDALRGIHTDLKMLVSRLEPENREKLTYLIANLDKWIESVHEQGAQVGLLLSKKARTRRRQLVLRQVVDEMAGPFQRYMDDMGIEFLNKVPADLRTPPMFECELQSILLNLQTNALKAVKHRRVRKIRVSAKRSQEAATIMFEDTGVGIDSKMTEEVFKPFVTTSDPDPVLGVGTGLGLKIVRDLVEVYGGTARFVEAHDEWKARLEITLPLRP